MAKVNPITEELHQIADALHAKYPGVILAVQMPAGNGKRKPVVVWRGDDCDRYWMAHRVWHQAPDPPSADDNS
jgi:Na+-translocating ferredoxin:NAD+ oxidoreductase RnfC subunit